MKKQGETYLVAYLETPDIDYLNAGWVNRIRAKSGKKKITLTYKKRVEIRNGDIVRLDTHAGKIEFLKRS